MGALIIKAIHMHRRLFPTGELPLLAILHIHNRHRRLIYRREPTRMRLLPGLYRRSRMIIVRGLLLLLLGHHNVVSLLLKHLESLLSEIKGLLHLVDLLEHVVRVVQGAGDLKKLPDLVTLRVVGLFNEALFDAIVAVDGIRDVLSVLDLVLFCYHIVAGVLHRLLMRIADMVVHTVLRLVECLELEAIARLLVQFLQIEVASLVLCEVRRDAEVLLPNVCISELLNR